MLFQLETFSPQGSSFFLSFFLQTHFSLPFSSVIYTGTRKAHPYLPLLDELKVKNSAPKYKCAFLMCHKTISSSISGQSEHRY